VSDFEDEFWVTDDEYDDWCLTFKNCETIGGDWTIITEPAKLR
jgi:hypothetical protein